MISHEMTAAKNLPDLPSGWINSGSFNQWKLNYPGRMHVPLASLPIDNNLLPIFPQSTITGCAVSSYWVKDFMVRLNHRLIRYFMFCFVLYRDFCYTVCVIVLCCGVLCCAMDRVQCDGNVVRCMIELSAVDKWFV